MPHGTLRHHFRDQAGYLASLAGAVASQVVDSVRSSGRPIRVDDSVAVAWLELSLIARRESAVRDQLETAYRRLLADVQRARSVSRAEAVKVVAAWEGQALDAARSGR